LLITSNPSAARVEGRFAIDQEAIPMMTMRKLHLEEPTTVDLSAHWMGEWIPPIEVTDEINGLRSGSRAIKIYWLGRIFSFVTVIGGFAKDSVHKD
jgi:hypothetical protein